MVEFPAPGRTRAWPAIEEDGRRMRSSTQALRRPSGPLERPVRRASGQAAAPAPRRPLQLELFGGGHPALPESRPRTPRPMVVPPPDTSRLELQRALNRLTGGRLSSLILTDNRRTILSVQAGRP